MLKRILLLNLIFTLSLISQSIDEVYKKIDLKLKRDKKYLNIFAFDVPVTEKNVKDFPTLPRTDERPPFQFKSADGYSYRIVYLKDAIGIDSVVLLYIDEIINKAVGGEGLFGEATGGVQIDTIKAVNFKDMYNIRLYNPEMYYQLYKMVSNDIKQAEFEDRQIPSLLGIRPDVDIKTSLGISSRDNTDFLNYMRANNLHWYPQEIIVQKGKRGAAPQSLTKPEFRIDASFTQLSFSHDIMNFGNLGGGSLEYGVTDRVLNVLPYQSMLFYGGFRTLITLSDKKVDYKNASILDAKFLGRIKMDFAKLATQIPFLFGDKPKLNVGTSVAAEISTTKLFSLPYLNFYLATGGNSFSSPSARVVIGGLNYAFYSFSQAEATMSFYWNGSDKLNTRFRMDIGIGYHDVWKGYFGAPTDKSPYKKELVRDNFSPVAIFHFNFSPEGAEFYGARIRYYDGQVSMNIWLKLAEFGQGHTFRMDATYLTPPIMRTKGDWETTGGALIQIRYRYGF